LNASGFIVAITEGLISNDFARADTMRRFKVNKSPKDTISA
jgi:hypothetical protein